MGQLQYMGSQLDLVGNLGHETKRRVGFVHLAGEVEETAHDQDCLNGDNVPRPLVLESPRPSVEFVYKVVSDARIWSRRLEDGSDRAHGVNDRGNLGFHSKVQPCPEIRRLRVYKTMDWVHVLEVVAHELPKNCWGWSDVVRRKGVLVGIKVWIGRIH